MTTDHKTAALIDCFDRLSAAITDIAPQLPHQSAAIWLPENAPHDTLSTALTDYWYRDDRDGRLTNTYFAVVLSSEQLRQKIHQINHLKNEFRAHCSNLRLDSQPQLRHLQV